MEQSRSSPPSRQASDRYDPTRLLERVPERLRPRLLPLHPDGKRPFRVSEGGFLWGDMPGVTEQIIEDWLRRYPNCAWGIRTGVVDGVDQGLCLVVADIDDPDLVPRKWMRYVTETAEMPVVRTARGFHVYGYSVRPVGSSRSLTGWVEWKAHPNALVKLHTSESLPAGAPMLWPQAFMDSLKQVDVAAPSPASERRTRRRRERGGQLAFMVADYGESTGRQAWNVKVPMLDEGRRHTGLRKALDRVIGRTPELKGNVELIRKWLVQVNAVRCDPPIDDKDIDDMALNAAKRSANWTGHTMGFIVKQGEKGIKSGKARRESTGERDRDIRAMREAGASFKEIEARHGLTRMQIHRILGR